MGKLTVLRVARWARGGSKVSEHPHLETLIDAESVKVGDGYHLARWICPLVGLFFALAMFLPMALTIHPLFWIGAAATTAIGGGLGGIFHLLARQIQPAQIRLRKRCAALGDRMNRFQNLIGMQATLSPKVAEVLDEAAQAFLSVPPLDDHADGVWAESSRKAYRALEEAMAQMLTLAEPETPQAQEIELNRGWARPMLDEMRATAASLASPPTGSAALDAGTPLADLADARAQLERLRHAVAELDQDSQDQRA